MSLKKVRLLKGVDYVYCFLKEKVIKEEECDYYEHNLECDKNDDVYGRTHSKGTRAGYMYATAGSTSVLNSCKYCLKKAEQYEEFYLPQEVTNKKRKKLFGLFGW